MYLIGPFFIVIGAALADGQTLTLSPQCVSLTWVAKVISIKRFRTPFLISMFLAIFGTLAALTFQCYALVLHLTVYQNIAFGLRLKKVTGVDARVAVHAPVAEVDPPTHDVSLAVAGRAAGCAVARGDPRAVPLQGWRRAAGFDRLVF